MRNHLLLLIFCALTGSNLKARLAVDWFGEIQQSMREMEESIQRMNEMMEETFASLQRDGRSDVQAPALKSEVGFTQDGVTLYFSGVEPAQEPDTLDAEFDENKLVIKHPQFNLQIAQRVGYNRAMLYTDLCVQQVIESTEKNKQSFKQAYYSSSSETVQIERAVQLDNPKITYDDKKKELSITLPYKTGKKIAIKRTEAPAPIANETQPD